MEISELAEKLKKDEKFLKKNVAMLQIATMRTRHTFADIVIERRNKERNINNNGDKK